jgi:2-C-methyl-D-erythritol 4-phosphate cytidylyltransferase
VATAAAVVLAAGSGTRMQAGRNKAYLPLRGRPMVAWSLEAVLTTPLIDRVLLVIRPDDRPDALEMLDHELPGHTVEVVDGGASRHLSELSALRHLEPEIRSESVDVVVLHDGARPLAGPDLMTQAVSTARDHGGAIPGVLAHDLVATDDGHALHPLSTDQRHVRVQTPQAFRAAPLLAAYEAATAAGFEGTDTSASMERFSDVAVHCFPGDPRNLKVTYAQDLLLAERLLSARPPLGTR